MATTESRTHEYRSYGAADGCAACVAELSVLRDVDRTVLDEVERVDYVRSTDEIARTVTGNPTIAADTVLASLERLAGAELVERRDVHRIVPSGPELRRLRPARQHVQASSSGCASGLTSEPITHSLERSETIMTHHEVIKHLGSWKSWRVMRRVHAGYVRSCGEEPFLLGLADGFIVVRRTPVHMSLAYCA